MFTKSPILAAAASPALLAKGCVNVIEFESLKEEAGARWPRIREGVCARLEAMLRTKLGPNDLFVPLGENGYLVTMPTTDPEDVSAICTRVAFDLHTSFLGQCSLDQVRVDSVAMDDQDTLLLRRLPLEKIVVLAEKAGIPASVIYNSLGSKASNSSDAQPFGLSPIGKAGRGGSKTSYAPPAEEPPPQVENHFVPIWQVPTAAVTTYVCEPRTISVLGRPQPVPLVQLSPEERVQVDLMALQAGITQLTQSWAQGTRFLLGALLAFDTIGTPAGRMEVLSVCRGLSQVYRSYLTFVIYDVPPGVAQTRLANMVTTLRPFGRGVLATINPTSRAYSAYQGIGLRGVGFNLREFTPQAPFCQNDAEQLAQFGRRSNLTTFLWDVRDKNVLKYAQDASIQNLSGPAVVPASAEPQGMVRLTWGEVLARPDVELWV